MKTLIDWLNEGYTLFSEEMLKQGIDLRKPHSMQNTLAVICKDGFSVSIQASQSHYCTPRKSFNRLESYSDFSMPVVDYSLYSEFELGYPSKADDLITAYAEDENDLTYTVYGWVPVDIVTALIEKHGGIVGYNLPGMLKLES